MNESMYRQRAIAEYAKIQGREAKREIKTGKCQIRKFGPKSAQKPVKNRGYRGS